MVLAISFLETPLKFHAPGVDLRVGLGIGRLVFRALNTVEAVLAALLTVMIVIDGTPAGPRSPPPSPSWPWRYSSAWSGRD